MEMNKTSSDITTSRRSILIGGISAVAAAAASLPGLSLSGAASAAESQSIHHQGVPTMESGYITTKDGVQIFYKDWGPKDAQVIWFHHGWPLTADDWDNQMMFFLANGYRVIAHDRRGHGRSTQTLSGNNMNIYAADVADVVAALKPKNTIHVGHSTGGGEVARYVASHGKKLVSKAVLVSSVPPIMVKSASNPDGVPKEVFDDIRKGTAYNRPQFYEDLTLPFYGYNRPGAKVSQAVRNNWWRQGMMGGVKAAYDCIEQFSEVDFTEDLKMMDMPVLVMHGEDDQIVPFLNSGAKSVKLLKNGKLISYPGFPHGMPTTHADIINADLLTFFKS
jgi:non-heme chloroperoxidase